VREGFQDLSEIMKLESIFKCLKFSLRFSVITPDVVKIDSTIQKYINAKQTRLFASENSQLACIAFGSSGY
jgi:hypothetical protein